MTNFTHHTPVASVGTGDDAATRVTDTEPVPNDAGMATTEYALVTVAAAGFAGVLVVLLKSAEVRDLLMGIVTSALG